MQFRISQDNMYFDLSNNGLGPIPDPKPISSKRSGFYIWNGIGIRIRNWFLGQDPDVFKRISSGWLLRNQMGLKKCENVKS